MTKRRRIDLRIEYDEVSEASGRTWQWQRSGIAKMGHLYFDRFAQGQTNMSLTDAGATLDAKLDPAPVEDKAA